MNIEELEADAGEWQGYSSSMAAITAWRKARDGWNDDRATVWIIADPQRGSHRDVSVPKARLPQFVIALLADPIVTMIKVQR